MNSEVLQQPMRNDFDDYYIDYQMLKQCIKQVLSKLKRHLSEEGIVEPAEDTSQRFLIDKAIRESVDSHDDKIQSAEDLKFDSNRIR